VFVIIRGPNANKVATFNSSEQAFTNESIRAWCPIGATTRGLKKWCFGKVEDGS